jgi:tRNA modification GTPase
MTDTIVAISTPLFASAIGIVRISGPCALSIGDALFTSVLQKKLSSMTGYTAAKGVVRDSEGLIDEVVATVFRAPKSYTGEDTAEFCCHGGITVLRRLERAAVAAGAVLASRGEFTKRAFLNGKLSLSECEAVIDVINAESDKALAAANNAKNGLLDRELRDIAASLSLLSASYLSYIDYPDDDIPEPDRDSTFTTLTQIGERLDKLIDTYKSNVILKNGVSVAICGAPNAGKSSLMNALLKRERSIVTPIPGTTRDVVEDCFELDGVKIRLFDTAGLRQTDDMIEQMGIDLTHKTIDDADIVIAVADSTTAGGQWSAVRNEFPSGVPVITVLNKSDIMNDDTAYCAELHMNGDTAECALLLSAKTGEGLPALLDAIKSHIREHNLDASAPFLYSERQQCAAAAARAAVADALTALVHRMPLDAVNAAAEFALDEILSLMGEKVTDRVLDEIFANFCVGK